ncbi:hypothetical protein N0V90_004824 [Kalmusia sp. IMI 367209]|nr:hypothetical protein N0V90_004824 [Kalmusia sp. IMI 367209]
MQRANLVLGPKAADSVKTFDIAGLQGYTVKATVETINTLAESDEIAYIEPDQIFTVASPAPKPVRERQVIRAVQANAPWGLARISHRAKGATDYVYNPTADTYIYVMDTGVKISHTKFEGRAIYGFNAVGGTNDDENGHGTHVAGTASSQTYGVVRFSQVISVKVLGGDGSGTTSGLISGINWAVQDIQSKSRIGKATALLALGGAYSAALNNAVKAASDAGLFFATAAGSSNTDNSGSSPGSEPSACTVGGTDINDARLSSSNYGPGIDIWAPGGQILSLWITSNTAVATISGTSSAAAHIAGLGVYFLALEGPRGAVALCERLREVATKNALTGIPTGTSNLLAYNLSGL